MKKCPNCKVFFKTERKSCPFCHNVLDKINEDNSYQEYPKYEIENPPKRTFLKICILVTLLIIVSTITINLLTINKENPVYWFTIVLGGLFFTWILVGVTIISKNNIVLKIILQAITVELILHSIEMNTELPTTFSLVYVIPFIFVAIILTSSILMLSMPKRAHSYILYLIIMSVLGIIPFIIILVKDYKPLWPSLCSLCVSSVTIIGIFFFGFRTLIEELRKKLHM